MGGPDIVLLMTDQQRRDQLGWASELFDTPNLDALAARGVRFDTAYSESSTCVPARIGLLTGAHPHRVPLSFIGSFRTLEPGTWTVAHALRGAGYQTALVGKMHFTPMHAEHGFDVMRTSEHLGASLHALAPDGADDVDDYHQFLVDEGVAEWQRLEPGRPPLLRPLPRADDARSPFPHELRLHATSWIEREVEAVLAARDPTRPLFLVVSFPHPHAPVNPLGDYASMYRPSDTPVPSDGMDVNDCLPEPMRRAFDDPEGAGPRPWRVAERGEPALRRRLAGVRGLVRHIDDAVGRLLGRFDADRTVVAFTSDHGDYAGHRGLASKQPWIPFDDLVRVPLVVAGPGIAGGRVEDALVSSADLPLTFCELAGVPVDADAFDSRSLCPLLEGRQADDDRVLLFATTMGYPAARTGSVKGIIHGDSMTGVAFDLGADPGETVDVSSDPAYRDVMQSLAESIRDELLRPRLERYWPGEPALVGPGQG